MICERRLGMSRRCMKSIWRLTHAPSPPQSALLPAVIHANFSVPRSQTAAIVHRISRNSLAEHHGAAEKTHQPTFGYLACNHTERFLAAEPDHNDDSRHPKNLYA